MVACSLSLQHLAEHGINEYVPTPACLQSLLNHPSLSNHMQTSLCKAFSGTPLPTLSISAATRTSTGSPKGWHEQTGEKDARFLARKGTSFTVIDQQHAAQRIVVFDAHQV